LEELLEHGPDKGEYVMWDRTRLKMIVDEGSAREICDAVAGTDRSIVRDHFGLVYIPPEQGSTVTVYYGQDILDLVEASMVVACGDS
jgi:hypothetical protein